MKKIWLLLFASLLFASPVSARWVKTPEGPTGSAVCSDKIDQDADGTADNCSGSADMSTADGNNRGITMSSAVIIAPYAALVDASAPSGNARELPLGSDPFAAEVMVSGSFANATTYGWITVNNPTGSPKAIWIDTVSLGNSPDNATKASIVLPTNGYEVKRIGTTGSFANFTARVNGTTQRTWALNGSHQFYLKWEPGLKVACIFFSPTSTFTPPSDSCSPGGTPAPNPDYIVKRVTTPPVDEADALWDLANSFTWQGYDNTSGLGASVCKALWQDTTTDKLFLMCDVPDTEIVVTSPAPTEDSATIITGSHDGIDFRWKSDLIRAFDANTYIVAADLQDPPVFADGDYSGTGGTRTLTPDLGTTTSRTVVASTSYKIFLALNLGFNATQGQQGLCQLAIDDKDTGVSIASKLFRGTTSSGSTDIQQFGICEFSSIVAEVPADTTAPTVTAGTPPEENILANSADIKFSSNESGTAVVKWDTVTRASCGAYANTSASKAVTGGVNEFISLSGLPDNDEIFYRACVTDAAGNTGTYASEESFTTLSLVTATHFVGPTAQGSANCSSDANRCLLANVWTTALGAHANVAAGSVITLADGTYTGANSMLVPPAGLSGTSGNPITVRATNDGGVLIDGGHVEARKVGDLYNNSWWVIEGINVCCAKPLAADIFGAVLQLHGGSNNNVIRRVIGWDAGGLSTEDGEVFGAHHSSNNLWEDIAAFGNGRKLFASTQQGNNTTIRRAFFCWGGSLRTGPKMDISLVYDHYNQIAENIISMFCQRLGTENMAANFSYDGITYDSGNGRKAFSKLYGSISVLVPGREFPSSFGVFAGSVDEIHMKDVISWYPPGEQTTKRTTMLTQCVTENLGSVLCTNPNLSITNYTSVGGTGIFAHAHWQQSNVKSGATLSDVYGAESLWANDGTKGATVCKRYVNGILTTDKLFPWPMRDRINAAVTASGRAVSYLWGDNTLNIDTFLEARFGTIPAACTS